MFEKDADREMYPASMTKIMTSIIVFDLLKDNISKLVRRLAIPASIGTLFQTLYNIVDTFYAGKISPEALSALGKSFPIYFIIIATSIGVTVAGTSLIGNSIGEKNNKKHIITTSIEHKAVLEPIEELKKIGFDVDILNVGKS